MVEPLSWPDYLHHKLVADWVLSPTCQNNCKNYFLRHWEAQYLKLQMIYSKDWGYWFVVGADGTKYRIITKDAPSVSQYNGEQQLALSFRAPAPELNLPAYVLVKGIAS